jgi:pyruvate/2-oxoglutarate/acetoin dehydrogenase E1 component
MSLNNLVPICVYPRWNFLLLAVNQLVNHLDKVQELNGSNSKSKVIIRTAVGSESPMYPGPQHIGDFTEAFKKIVDFEVLDAHSAQELIDMYEFAMSTQNPVMIVEHKKYF